MRRWGKAMGKYKYTDFTMENNTITFGCDGVKDILISIPFAEDTPESIKDTLNEIINQAVDEWLEGDMIEGCMPVPKELLLNARMQINYDSELGVLYFIAVTISDLIPDIGMGVWIDKDVNVNLDSVLHNDLVTYCRYKLDQILFP